MDRKLLVIFENNGDLTWDLSNGWKDFRENCKKYAPDVSRGDIHVAFWVCAEADDLDFYKE